MEKLKDIVDKFERFQWVFDNPLASFILMTALGLGLWWMISTYKNRKFRKIIKEPEWEGHLKILVTNFSGTQNPFSQGGRKVVHELHDKCIESINKTSRRYLGTRKIKTFPYYKGLRWKTGENSQLAPSTIEQAQKLGQKLGVDLVITGKSLKNDSSNYIAIIPVTGSEICEHETLSLDTTKGQLETLLDMLAGGVAYYVGKAEPAEIEGLFLAEGPAQMQVDILGPILMNPKITLTDVQRTEMKKAYRYAIESVIKCYYFPSREALKTSIGWMEEKIEQHPDDTGLKILYARAQLEANLNKNDNERVGQAFDMLLSIPEVDGSRGDEAEHWLNDIADLRAIPDDHPRYDEFEIRKQSGFDLAKPDSKNIYSIYRYGLLERTRALYSNGDVSDGHGENAIKAFSNVVSKLAKSEPVFINWALSLQSACYEVKLRQYFDLEQGIKLAEEVDNVLANKLRKSHSSARIRYLLFKARFNISSGVITRANLPYAKSKDWKKRRHIFARAAFNATKFGYCNYDQATVYNSRGLSRSMDSRKSRELKSADLKASVELREVITGKVALAGRGNLAHTRIMDCIREWDNICENTNDLEQMLSSSEIQSRLNETEGELIDLLCSSELPLNLYNHGNYLHYLGELNVLRSKVFSTDSDISSENIFISLKRAALFFRLGEILHFLVPGQKSMSKIESAENCLNLLEAYEDSSAQDLIPVPEYLKDTISFLDKPVPDWREQVLSPSLHFDPNYKI